jgi:hypothetical protein
VLHRDNGKTCKDKNEKKRKPDDEAEKRNLEDMGPVKKELDRTVMDNTIEEI